MEAVLILLYLIGGTLILTRGADLFVGSASKIAKTLGVSAIVIGLTVVAFGTSAPELAVSLIASYRGNSGIAIGNVVGSNIFNIAVILGTCALIMPLMIKTQLLKIDIPIMVFSSLLVWLFSKDQEISRIEGGFLFLGILTYTALQIRLALKEREHSQEEFEKEYSDQAEPLKDGLFLLIGLGMLVGGADLFVEGAVRGARLLGWSETVIGLTIIAAGTSLPEVATSVAATLKGERDIAIGNVVGSNIFNIFSVLGMSALVKPVPIEQHVAQVDIVLMVIVTTLVIPLTLGKHVLGRVAGVIFVSIWISYTAYLIMNAK